MVDEYLSEQEQAERLRIWFRENWLWIVAGVALGLGGLYGYRWWDAHLLQRSTAAEQRYSAMLDALSRKEREEGLRLAAEITGDYADTPYADHTTLLLARLDIEAGDFVAAAGRLEQVARDSDDPELALVARLRLARVQLAQGQHEQALATLSGLAAPSVDARVLELRGDVLSAKGDAAGALAAYRQALAGAGDDALAEGLVDSDLLELKIDELAAQQAGT